MTDQPRRTGAQKIEIESAKRPWRTPLVVEGQADDTNKPPFSGEFYGFITPMGPS
ncbi:hypothetical protein AB5I39_04795 [Sphingomonas sp. MMS24-J45]|uniref:hypothetical protein n=1 Tax=Sphingomonas sp. MMS24-J45 TaxID=3238806 RepID=UPI00384F05A7